MFQLGALAVGTGVLHHDLLQILLHPGVSYHVAPVVAVLPLDLVDDPVVAEQLAHLLLPLGRALRQHYGEALALRAVQHQIHRLRR